MKNRLQILSTLLVVLCFCFTANAQNPKSLIQDVLNEKQEQLELSKDDISNWVIVDQHTSEKFDIEYVYVNQTDGQNVVYNAMAVFAIKNQKAVLTSNTFIPSLQQKIKSNSKGISEKTAILIAAKHLDITSSNRITKQSKNENSNIYAAPSISRENITVTYKLFPVDSTTVKGVWELDIYALDQKHWWSIRVDAQNGTVLDQTDWVVSCDIHPEQPAHYHNSNQVAVAAPAPPTSAGYNVFPIPVESPNHGSRQLLADPSDITSSPFGWHDTDGSSGAEFTDTRGNNVFASEDRNDNGGFGYAPDGGVTLDFDFPLNLNQAPINYEDVAITNLFYMNNIMHDVWYHYGFDEASGNFQENNYGNGGIDSDPVNAEAQDGGGMNNANFATPPDGSNPRMQMYLWSAPTPNLLTVNSPSSVGGPYNAEEAAFGVPVPATPITADLVIYDDNTPDEMDACEPAVNGAALNGKIVLIRRGSCTFVDKVQNAENEGAVAVIVINNVAGGPIVMGGTGPGIGIPSVMISDVDGANLIAEIQGGSTVNATLVNSGVSYEVDGDFDNGIIAHEYGHGISNRLTGGASNSNCLSNAEQMGEGWSDWFALMVTLEPGDQPDDIRGIGTYAIGETPTGTGIRPAPYSTDFNINNFTYAATNNTGQISQPHGIGFVWSTMLWDMTWALIDKYGFDPDIYNGTGGNNIAMHLVMNGIKLQPCGPGFVDGRDAILQADQMLYGGANQCLIWNVFANRGLGYSADQGSANSRTDQTEAFDLPPGLTATSGSESVTACDSFTWSANGQTYTTSGSYTATLQNSFGCDSTATLNLTINQGFTDTTNIAGCGSYTWSENSQTYTSSGIYTESYTAINGCDSTITLNLTLQPQYNTDENITVCDQYTWTVNGQTYNNSGSYSETLISTNGCDSIVTLNLTVNNSLTSSEDITVCDQYTWTANGQTYNNSGSFTEVLSSVDGCDSTVTLNLTVIGNYNTTETVSECNSYTWAANGQTYNSSGSYSETLISSEGCDSIVTLDLTILPTLTGSENIIACDQYTWAANGQTYTTSGSYTENLVASNGCDSIATLNLTIESPAPGSLSETACENYTWADNGQTYTQSGAYTTIISSVNGCDSTVTLYLTINNPSAGFETVSACDNYTWPTNGQTYQSSGSYTTTLTSANGCDSTAILNLTITQPTNTIETASSCNTYFWNAAGQSYSTSGTYSTTLTGSNGCDSTVTLNLTITQPTSGSESVATCDTYTWTANNQTYNTSGSYTAVLTGSNGCDSTATLNLTIENGGSSIESVSACKNYTWSLNNQTYTSSGQYTETVPASNGCDSTVTLDLTLESINTSVSVDNSQILLEAISGYDSYQWINCDRDDAPIPGATQSSYEPTNNGSYAVIISNNGCTDTSACEIIYSVGTSSLESNNIQIYPNPTKGNVTLELSQGHGDVDIRIFDISGKLVTTHHLIGQKLFQFDLQGSRGVYIIEVRNENGIIARERISKMF